jgi:ABC-type nitrate/sulfonate/bicarbonate transport system permease component
VTGSAVGGTSGTGTSADLLAATPGDQQEAPRIRGGVNPQTSPWSSPAMLAAQLAVIGLTVTVWWYVSAVTPTGIVPSPAHTFSELAVLLRTGALWTAVGQTAITWLIGIAVCTAVGIPVGLAIGASRLATDSTRLAIDFVRNIPPVALVPVGLLLWGPNRSMVLLLVFSGTIWPILIQSIYASRQTDPQLRDVARVFHLGRRWWLTHIFLPGVAPFVMTGLRVAATICLLLTLTGELFGGAPGVGTQIQNAQVGNNNPQMYAYVVIAALLGLLVNSLIWAAQWRLLRWHPSFQKRA